MIWKKFPHFPIPNSTIYYYIKSLNNPRGAPYKMRIKEGENLSHIEKWCYEEEMSEEIKRKLKEFA